MLENIQYTIQDILLTIEKNILPYITENRECIKESIQDIKEYILLSITSEEGKEQIIENIDFFKEEHIEIISGTIHKIIASITGIINIIITISNEQHKHNEECEACEAPPLEHDKSEKSGELEDLYHQQQYLKEKIDRLMNENND